MIQNNGKQYAALFLEWNQTAQDYLAHSSENPPFMEILHKRCWWIYGTHPKWCTCKFICLFIVYMSRNKLTQLIFREQKSMPHVRRTTWLIWLSMFVLVRGETLIISVFLVLGMVHTDQLVTSIAWLLSDFSLDLLRTHQKFVTPAMLIS